MSTLRWGAASGAAMLFATVLVGVAPGAAGAVPARRSAPTVSDTGRLHALTPARVLDSTTGLGVPSGPVPAHAKVSLKITGTGGVPKTGVSTVVVTLSGIGAVAPTQLWLGPSNASKPDLATVVLPTAGANGSAFAFVTVPTGGKITIWNGAAATDVALDVTGWVSSTAESGTAGLFDALAPRTVLDATTNPLTAGEQRDVTLSGVAGIPSAGVRAVLLRVATHATAPGNVAVVPKAASLAAVTTMSYAAGESQDFAFAALGTGAEVTVVNNGSSALGLTLSVAGYVTDGSDPNAIGDTFAATAPGALLSATVGTTSTRVQLAGVDAIPAATDPTPAISVLVQIAATAATTDGALLLDPSGGEPTGASALLLHGGRAATGVALVTPGTDGAAVAATTAGSATVTADAIGYFSGSVSLQPNLKPLDADALAAITSVTPDAITFAGVPSELASVAVGDVLAGGISPTTPQGLLRTVTALDTSGGNLTLSTTQASLSDAIAQGRLSAGREPDAVGGASTPAARAAAQRATASGSDACEEQGDIFSGSLGASCTVSDDFGPVSVSVGASANLGFSFDASIHWGFPPSLDLSASATASASVSGNVTASVGGAVDQTVSLPGWKGEPIEFSIGPVPVVIVPEVDPSLKVTGSLSANQSVTGTVTAGATLAYSTSNGVSLTPIFDANGNATLGADAVSGDVRVSFVPEVKADFYDSGAGIGAAVVPYVDAQIDPCNVTGTAGVQLDVTLSAGKLVPDASDIDWSWTPAQTQIFAFPWHPCAYWTGTIAFSQKTRTTDAADPLYLDRESYSLTTTLEDLGRPDASGIFATGSGSGTFFEGRSDQECGTQDTYTDNWSGAVDDGSGGPLSLRITPLGGRKYSAEPWNGGGSYFGIAQSTETSHVWGFNSHGVCHATNTTSVAPFEVLLQAPAPLTIHLPKGGTEVKGRIPLHQTQTVGPDTQTTSSVLDYDLVVKCSLGATACGLPS